MGIDVDVDRDVDVDMSGDGEESEWNGKNQKRRVGRKEKSNAHLYLYERYDIYFPHPQQFFTSTLRRRYISSISTSSMRRELSFFLFSAFAQNVSRLH